MGQMFLLFGSLAVCSIGVTLYISGVDGKHWLYRAIAAVLVVVAIELADSGQRAHGSTLLAKLAAVYAMVFLGMAAYSLYLLTIT